MSTVPVSASKPHSYPAVRPGAEARDLKGAQSGWWCSGVAVWCGVHSGTVPWQWYAGLPPANAKAIHVRGGAVWCGVVWCGVVFCVPGAARPVGLCRCGLPTDKTAQHSDVKHTANGSSSWTRSNAVDRYVVRCNVACTLGVVQGRRRANTVGAPSSTWSQGLA